MLINGYKGIFQGNETINTDNKCTGLLKFCTFMNMDAWFATFDKLAPVKGKYKCGGCDQTAGRHQLNIITKGEIIVSRDELIPNWEK